MPQRYCIEIELSFELCRWLVEDEDVEGVHRVPVKHHKCLTSRPL